LVSWSEERRQELGRFLRTRRQRVDPDTAGLPRTGRRRTPGLRREEVAFLAGISATWYTYLEQGRDVRVSISVVENVSRVLGLNRSERIHLFVLTQGAPPPDAARAPEALDGRFIRLLDVLDPNPAYVTDARSDLLGWNRAAGSLFTGFDRLPGQRRNLLWWAFTDPAAREVLADWEAEARALLARYRAASARHCDEPEFAALIEDLSRLSPHVADWWPRHDVQSSASGTKRLRHPKLGMLTLDHTVLQVAENPELKLVIYCGAPGSAAADALATVVPAPAVALPET
jgi:transcriptional regulator with XRE-family HTH domain